MRNACIVVQDLYKNNKLFDLNDLNVNRDNCMYSFYCLKMLFEENNINLSTQDINSIEESEIVLYIEMPETLPEKVNSMKSYLILFESEVIISENWKIEKHKYFNKIFTWNDDFVDNKRYFKFNFSHKIPLNFKISNNDRMRFCTLIAGNKRSNNINELYSERIRAIKWFEKNHIDEFDLYGTSWDKPIFLKPFHILNRFKITRKLFASKYISYKGKVNSKQETLLKYKFAICYENAKNIPGYITEKIFDCFFAGTIPVYLGAPNISDFIPNNCFIDKRDYKSYDELYHYLKIMSKKEVNNYLKSIEKFVNSHKIDSFSAEKFAEIIVTNVIQRPTRYEN